MTDNHHIEFLRSAFDKYLIEIDADRQKQSDGFLPYDFEEVDTVQWDALGGFMVKDELSELTNRMNFWLGALRKWSAWNAVVASYDEMEAWELRHEFLETLAHYCLLQPSTLRDTFTFVVTNAMHQVRLASSSSYRDYMVGDPKGPNERTTLQRKQKENRLAEIISTFPQGIRFMELLENLNDESYRRQTSNYRNLNTHSIGPRLGIGITRMVVRSVVQTTKMEEQPNGRYKAVAVPGKMVAQYAFGGTEALDLDKALALNVEQYRQARRCYSTYRDMLASALASVAVGSNTRSAQ